MTCTPWQKGDLALCVKRGWSIMDPTRPGGVYVVERVWINPNGRHLCLGFVGVDSGTPYGTPYGQLGFWGHRASRFRKIEPHTPDEEDAEIIRLLTGKKAEVG